MQAHIIEIDFEFNGKPDTLYPVLLVSPEQKILVDGGYAGFLPKLEEALQKCGYSLPELTGLLLTHHDLDHVGALYELKEKYPHLKIYSSAVEARYISGQQKSARLQQAEDLQPFLPADQKQGGLAFQEFLRSYQPVPVDVIFPAEEEPEIFGGAKVIFTPGHTPGHFSLYLPESKTLIAGDAVVVEGGELEIANPTFTLDPAQAVASVQRLSQLELDHLICYHGGLVQGNLQESLQKLAAKYSVA
ncbi:MAG: MBL fold metallo-hydrolase [Rufibacter sp.]